MDEVPNSDVNIDNEGLYSSTIPWFDCDEVEYLSKICGLHQEQPDVGTNVISSTPIENHEEQKPTTSTKIAIDDEDDYSLSSIYSMRKRKGVSSDGIINQENLKTDLIDVEKLQGGEDTTTINNSSIRTKEKVMNLETTSDMNIHQQPMQKIPILEIFERESSMKGKFGMDDNPLRISTISSSKDHENPNHNNLPIPKSIPCLGISDHSMKPTNHPSFGMDQEYPRTNPKLFMDHMYTRRAGEQQNPKSLMPNIPTLDKLESELMKSKYGIGNAASSRKQDEMCYGILNSSDNDQFLQNPSGSNDGPIRRSHSRRSSRYQPLGSSNPISHPNNNLQSCPPAYTHDITNKIAKFKGVASGQNIPNENIGAPHDQSQSSSVQQKNNAQDSHLKF